MAELLDEFLASLEDFGERELTVEDDHGVAMERWMVGATCHGKEGQPTMVVFRFNPKICVFVFWGEN